MVIKMNQNLEDTKYLQTKPYSILVTGSTGFIGSRLVSFLSASGYTVKGLSRKNLPDTNNVKYIQADVF